MNKYTLLALAALSQTVAYGSGEKFNKNAHDEHIKTQIQLGTATVASAGMTYFGAKKALSLLRDFVGEDMDYADNKKLRLAEYKQNPSWKKYINYKAHGIKSYAPIGTKFVLSAACGAVAATAGLATYVLPQIMWDEYREYSWNNRERNKEKNA